MRKTRIFLALLIACLLLSSQYAEKVYAISLSTKSISWYYKKSTNHKTPVISKTTKKLLEKYNAYYVHNTKKKVVYLTFDLGYENGYTSKILSVLKKHNINATFFVCKAFITYNPKGLKKMVKDGNLVANHSVNHKNFALLTKSQIKSELGGVEAAYKKVTGKKMAKFVRPPEGRYSLKSLSITKDLGYTTIFWSITLPNDWDMKNQPSKTDAMDLFKKQYHNGSIILLHAVSPAVANNLDGMLTQLEDKGYEFHLVTDMLEKEYHTLTKLNSQ